MSTLFVYPVTGTAHPSFWWLPESTSTLRPAQTPGPNRIRCDKNKQTKGRRCVKRWFGSRIPGCLLLFLNAGSTGLESFNLKLKATRMTLLPIVVYKLSFINSVCGSDCLFSIPKSQSQDDCGSDLSLNCQGQPAVGMPENRMVSTEHV